VSVWRFSAFKDSARLLPEQSVADCKGQYSDFRRRPDPEGQRREKAKAMSADGEKPCRPTFVLWAVNAKVLRAGDNFRFDRITP